MRYKISNMCLKNVRKIGNIVFHSWLFYAAKFLFILVPINCFIYPVFIDTIIF